MSEVSVDSKDPTILTLGEGRVIVGHALDVGGLPAIVLGSAPAPMKIGEKPTEEAAQHALREGAVAIRFTSFAAMTGFLDVLNELAEAIVAREK